jgi:hypothetical protein
MTQPVFPFFIFGSQSCLIYIHVLETPVLTCNTSLMQVFSFTTGKSLFPRTHLVGEFVLRFVKRVLNATEKLHRIGLCHVYLATTGL